MAGIYIHIPFCKQACHYCDFHFSTSLAHKKSFLEALLREIEMRKEYLNDDTVESIYFGGGTPSLMEPAEINEIFESLLRVFHISEQAEITLEANPDDLNQSKVNALKKTAVNRFSLGIQSFYDEDLKWMNRAHNASEADASIKRVQDAGFENITCDLIYGFPLLSDAKLKSNIERLIANKVPHISAYAMTIEDKTALATFIRKGKQAPMDEAQGAQQLLRLMELMESAGYEQYEISNFAQNQHYSLHNTNYWRGVNYLGLGPSAHSFDRSSRSWNLANNHKYIAAIMDEQILPSETEILTSRDIFNEYILTSLRTKWGIDLNRFTSDDFTKYVLETTQEIEQYVKSGEIFSENKVYKLTRQGKLFADRIASALFRLD